MRVEDLNETIMMKTFQTKTETHISIIYAFVGHWRGHLLISLPPPPPPTHTKNTPKQPQQQIQNTMVELNSLKGFIKLTNIALHQVISSLRLRTFYEVSQIQQQTVRYLFSESNNYVSA